MPTPAALGSLAAVYNYVDTSVYPVVNVYIYGKISEGTVTKTEYPGLTLNILPANASGDEITGLTAVSNINLGNITVGKLSMVSGIVTNTPALLNGGEFVAVFVIFISKFNEKDKNSKSGNNYL